MNNTAFIAIDVQRGFMPANEGERLQLDGFGELPVANGERIIKPMNRFIGWAAAQGLGIVTTQDWHPYETAHFADEGTEPNYRTTWTRHCVGGTPGAELHPELVLPHTRTRFLKGEEHLKRGEDDLSYSAFYAKDPITGITLPEWLKHRKITNIVLGGLTIDHCLGKTGLDFLTKTDIDVTALTDLTKPVAEQTGIDMQRALVYNGATLMTSDEYINLAQAA